MSVNALIATYKTLGSIEDRRLRPPLDDLSGSELAVVRWLLWRLQDDGCHPSDADIAVGTGLSSRSIRRARIGLRDRGLIKWEERRSAGKRSSNTYDLTAILSACASELPDKSAQLPDKSASTNGQIGPELPDKMAEEKKNREVEEEKKEEAAAAAASLSDFDEDRLVAEVYDFWNSEVWPDKHTPLTEDRRAAIVDRLDHFDPEHLREAIAKRKLSDWFSGRKANDGRERYDLTDLLASDGEVEELRGLKSQREANREWVQSFGKRGSAASRADADIQRLEGLKQGLRDPALARICARPVDDYSRYDAVVETAEVSAVPPGDSGAEVQPIRDHYAEEVEAAVVVQPLTAAQTRAEHAQLVDDLEALKDQYAENERSVTLKAVEQRRSEIAELEAENPDLFGGGEVAA